MATQFADILFFAIAAAIVVAQAFILRSTARGLRYADDHAGAGAPPTRTALEWAYAIVPAVALAALLVFSWRTMHPAVLRARGVTPPPGVSDS